MWKDFFYFSKTERQGIIVLVVLILGVWTVFKLYSAFSLKEAAPKEQEVFEKEYNEFIASLQTTERVKKNSKDFRKAYPEREIRLAPFDPNTADSITLLNLGLPPWMAKNILRYRNKQGRFRRLEDFRKIYGLTEEQYQTLQPYIQINSEFINKNTIRLLAERKEPDNISVKYQPGTIVDLNNADTTELKKIPGIGSGIARMIVNYRRQLGGYYSIEQLREIHLKVELLRSWFSVDASQITRINLNKASVERMTHHPYFSFYQAKVIMEYRKKKGKLNSLSQLSLYEEFTPDDFVRLRPYVCTD